MKNRLGTYLIVPKWRFWKKNFLDVSKKKLGFAYAQSPRKCSNIKILATIEGKEAKFFSKIYEGHIRIWFRSKENSKLSHACVPLRYHYKTPRKSNSGSKFHLAVLDIVTKVLLYLHKLCVNWLSWLLCSTDWEKDPRVFRQRGRHLDIVIS